MPGAPMALPYVEPVSPKPPFEQVRDTGSAPQLVSGPARFRTLKMLKISIRNWAVSRSVIGVFLITEKSTDLKVGP